jgi:N12 class adenine-specific DNA methylase
MTVPSEEQNVSNHAIRESTEEAGEQDAIARYLNPEYLEKRGLSTFDDWAKGFSLPASDND